MSLASKTKQNDKTTVKQRPKRYLKAEDRLKKKTKLTCKTMLFDRILNNINCSKNHKRN
ncbi:hypothetical protein Bca4012_068202 [Brassica carinata]